LIEAKELLSLIVEETGRKREKANRWPFLYPRFHLPMLEIQAPYPYLL
jgi:hypothetical protein